MKRLVPLLVAVLLASGCQRARRTAPIEAAPPAAHGDVVYVGDERGRIHAVAAGAERWAFDFGGELERESPGATRDAAIAEIATAEDGSVVALVRSETGATRGAVYLVAVSPDGVERWHRSVDPPSGSARPLAVGRDVYVAQADGSLHAYALADGSDRWSYVASGASLGSPHVGGDGTIYVRGPRGRVHAVSPDGAELWVYTPGS
jgi:outer membrane protein assembly factor BamB